MVQVSSVLALSAMVTTVVRGKDRSRKDRSEVMLAASCCASLWTGTTISSWGTASTWSPSVGGRDGSLMGPLSAPVMQPAWELPECHL